MPKFVIERQYLIPMYQHIAIDAESLEVLDNLRDLLQYAAAIAAKRA
jgi:hypothetical protein